MRYEDLACWILFLRAAFYIEYSSSFLSRRVVCSPSLSSNIHYSRFWWSNFCLRELSLSRLSTRSMFCSPLSNLISSSSYFSLNWSLITVSELISKFSLTSSYLSLNVANSLDKIYILWRVWINSSYSMDSLYAVVFSWSSQLFKRAFLASISVFKSEIYLFFSSSSCLISSQTLQKSSSYFSGDCKPVL